MKYKFNFTFYIAITQTVLFSFISFNCNKAPLEPKVYFIRANVKLDVNNIPVLEGTKKTKMGEKPTLWEEGWEENAKYYVLEFSHSWESEQHDFINVDLIVTETAEFAHKCLIERRKYCAEPLDILEPEDRPAVVGDVSYGNGRQFIRDNLIVDINADGEFKEKLKDIAIQIDALLLKSPVAISADQMKPVIDKFEIAQHPVKRNSITQLQINVKDPMKGKLYYDWRFTPGSENYGGIEIDQAGNYNYYAETYYSEEELTILVFNDSGFYSSSTIYIQIQP